MVSANAKFGRFTTTRLKPSNHGHIFRAGTACADACPLDEMCIFCVHILPAGTTQYGILKMSGIPEEEIPKFR
jgi:hypothetical protein